MRRNTLFKSLLTIVFILPLAYNFIWLHGRTTAQTRQQDFAKLSDKPVEEIFKNIQVFRGMPKSQFPRTMDFMTASLGVDCDYCHLSSAWESDAKPAKQVSREMILMMRNINDKNFNGKMIVNCATCHQGHPKPIAEPPLDQIALRTRVSNAPAKPITPVSLPSVEQVIDRYVDALGGRSAFEKLNTRLIKSTLSFADGTTASQEVYMKAPDKAVFVTTTGAEITSQGFTGAIGWLKNNRVRRQLSGPTLNQLRFNSEFNPEIRLKELFAEMRVTGKEKVGDREVYVVEAKPIYSDPRKLYFDTETGLLIRTLIEETCPLGSTLDQMEFSDYRNVNGVKLPFLIRRTSLWENSVMRIIEVKHNVSISDVKFDMPAQ
ncbi:MAG TPA: c-type cytochrome [Pyrinomonadaceae bacterium]|nr:c-type cytochrome [Pyrinomonadaceae bacterium]